MASVARCQLAANDKPQEIEDNIARLRELDRKYADKMKSNPDIEEFGAGEYYMARLRQGFIVPMAEWEVVRFIAKNFATDTQVIEIGCGWGQVLAMLAILGYDCTGIDQVAARLRGANFLRELAGADDPAVADRLHYRIGQYPDDWKPGGSPALSRSPRLLGFFSNLGIGSSEEFCTACTAELRSFDFAIMDILRFWKFRDSNDQDIFLRDLHKFGYCYRCDIYKTNDYRFVSVAADRVSKPPDQ